MQFRHPEILYVLFALLIPVFIHLFQLQRFVKTEFTNVKFLKQILLQTRKSSRLKKWLVLLSRLLALAVIIIAFAQPYYAKNKTHINWNTSIYIDNSWSMKARGSQGELLKRTIQDLAENLPDKGTYNLLTNDRTFGNLEKTQFVEKLKKITYSSKKSTFQSLFLRLKQFESDKQKSIFPPLLLSDFQNTDEADFKNQRFNFVQNLPVINNNISIDSVQIKDIGPNKTELVITIKNQGTAVENIGISAYSKNIVLAKSTFDISQDTHKSIRLEISKANTDILIKIDPDDCYPFDNLYYSSINKTEKIKVLLIGDKKYSFLDKIYTKDAFILSKSSPNQIAYNTIDKQQLIILQTKDNIVPALQNKLKDFVKQGGTLLIIPTEKTQTKELQSVFTNLSLGHIEKKVTDSLYITKIHYSHPLLAQVFERKISNFQYPVVSAYYEAILPKALPILSFENNQAFISETPLSKGKVFWCAAPLERSSGNFTDSPLIVPIFYNIAKQSAPQIQLSNRLGEKNRFIVNTQVQEESVLHIKNSQIDFIPRQEILSDRVIIYTEIPPNKPGFYSVEKEGTILLHIAYNTPKQESNMSYLTTQTLLQTASDIHAFPSVKKALNQLKAEQDIHSFFKWFVLLSLLFIIIEILLLKFL